MASERRYERGSVLMLMPAAVLVMVIMGAIAVDRAVIFGAQRELVATAQAVANDAASLGVDVDRLRADGEIAVDLEAMAAAVDLAMVSARPGTEIRWGIEGDDVVVELSDEVDLVFAPALPGASTKQVVTARATAELRLSDP